MEKLYNGIVLEDDFREEPSLPQNVPYLKNPPSVIDVTVGRQLFVDDFLVEQTDLAPVYHRAKKYEGNPILKPEKPWEIEQSPTARPTSGGVWFDEEEKIFKMWYEGAFLHNMCYATSKDGIHWDRPDLGDGTNKILHYEGYENRKMWDDIAYLRPDSTSVIIDYEGKKEERYKLFLRNPGPPHPGIVATSGDGIHFENFKFTPEVGDRTTAFYNPFRKKWVYSIRTELRPWSEGFLRGRSYRECDDFLEGATWTPEEARHWMSVDELDKPHPYLGVEPQLYNVDCIGYESIMLGMFQIFYGPENNITDGLGVPKITELIPMYSRDGYHFSRPSRKPIINASLYDGAWDRGYVQSTTGGLIINGDELMLYYTATAGDENYTYQHYSTNGTYRNGATGIATLRRDGFVSMEGKGILLTRTLTMNGKSSFFVNAVGSVRAELLDEEGTLLATSTRFEGDSTKAELSFENFDVATLNGKTFRIRFDVDGALYAFGFADENGEFGGARAAGIVK